MSTRAALILLALFCVACTVPSLAASALIEDEGHDIAVAGTADAYDRADLPDVQAFPIGKRYVLGTPPKGIGSDRIVSPGSGRPGVGFRDRGARAGISGGRFVRWYPPARRSARTVATTDAPSTPPVSLQPTLSPGIEVEPGLYRFSGAELQAMRRALPSEWYGADDTRYGGIWKSTVDPMRILAQFPSLRIRDGYVFRAYVSRTNFDSHAWVFAMPAALPFPEPNVTITRVGPITGTFDFTGPVLPPEADEAIMDYIESDGSSQSYLEAVVFRNEVLSFAEYSHSAGWSRQVILDRQPRTGDSVGSDPWTVPAITYRELPPDVWSPTVRMTPERVTVTVYSIGTFYPANGVYRTTVNFTPGAYTFAAGSGSHSVGEWEPEFII